MTTLHVCKIHYLNYMTPPSPEITVHKTLFSAYRYALNAVKHESLAKFDFHCVMRKLFPKDLLESKKHDERHDEDKDEDEDDDEGDICKDYSVDKLEDGQLKEAIDLFNKYSGCEIISIISTTLLD